MKLDDDEEDDNEADNDTTENEGNNHDQQHEPSLFDILEDDTKTCLQTNKSEWVP